MHSIIETKTSAGLSFISIGTGLLSGLLILINTGILNWDKIVCCQNGNTVRVENGYKSDFLEYFAVFSKQSCGRTSCSKPCVFIYSVRRTQIALLTPDTFSSYIILTMSLLKGRHEGENLKNTRGL